MFYYPASTSDTLAMTTQHTTVGVLELESDEGCGE